MPSFLSGLARMFTVPRRVREQIAKIPGAHLIVEAAQAETVAVAQHIVDQHVTDPELAERIKSGIEAAVPRAIPAPPAHDGPVEQLVEGLVRPTLQSIIAQQPAAPAVPPPPPAGSGS